MESSPSRVNAPLEGPVIPRSRRDLFKDQSFGESDNAGIRQTGRTRVRRSMQRKGGAGGWSAPGMMQCRGTRRWETVVGVCLVPEEGCRYGGISNGNQIIFGLGEVIRSNL